MQALIYVPLPNANMILFGNKVIDPVFFHLCDYIHVPVYVLNKLVCHNVNMKYYEINNFYIPVFHFLIKQKSNMKRLLSLSPILKYSLYMDLWEALGIQFICMIFIIQGHASLSFS